MVIPITLETTENFSFPPFKIMSMASAGMLSIGSDNLNPNFSPISSNCLKIQVLFCSPKGAKPPFFIEVFGLGMILLRLISFTTPSPLQFGQAPFGELNEKLLGSGLGYEIPEVGHIKLRL